ncbi:choice-of-anchor P family protein [Nonomuraea sp. NPDC059007]|uniref:choice-of-anchor P family protein n=1 Tax=Nonomuraea sp. NPDC059007 TaxID=3346692 RepID=UPI0036BF1973
MALLPRGRSVALIGVLIAALMVALTGNASADTQVTVTVRIDYLKQIDNPDDASGDGDYYPVATIAGERFPRGPRIEDDEFEPLGLPEAPNGWVFSKAVNLQGNDTTVDLAIEIWDYDDGTNFGDDQMDLSKNERDLTLDLEFDIVNATFSGDNLAVGTPCLRDGVPKGHTCAEGNGDFDYPEENDGAKTRIGFTISSTVGSSTDSDGDGLTDLAEIHGIRNADGSMALDLKRFGANPLRKDVFLELDYSAGEAPGRVDIQAMKNAMKSAPISNPDGSRGINLWVDTGNLVDTTVRRQQQPGTCFDDLDNGLDGQRDGADADCLFIDASAEDPSPGGRCTNADVANPACLVGDDLGGGGMIGALNNCGIDAAFNAAAGNTNNFAAVRRGVFRYAISTSEAATCTSGGQASTNNRFFVDYNHDGGTLLHELGHTLRLEHGGDVDVNCKPNYVSAMNYDLQFGIPRVGGGRIVDFSPPRLALDGTSRGKVLRPLTENALDELLLDADDNENRFIFVNGRDQRPGIPGVQGAKVTEDVNVDPDWNDDGDEDDNPVNPAVNINTAGPPDPVTGARDPADCATNTSSTDTLTGFDDWARVATSIPFTGFAGGLRRGADLPVVAEPLPEQLPTLEQLKDNWEAVNTTDVGVAITAAPDPVRGGETLTWTVKATNEGPNPASSVEVTTTLPPEVAFVDSTGPCVRDAAKVTCHLGELTRGTSRQITIRAKVQDDVVHSGEECTITATAVIDNLAGPDPNAANDTARAETHVLVKTGLKVNGPANVANDAPATLKATLTDAADRPVKDRPVTLTLGTGSAAQSCQARTDAAGVASCVIASVAQPATATSVAIKASFTGDACYLPSDASGTAKLLYYTGRSHALSVKPILLPQTVVADTGEVSTSARSTTEKTAAAISLALVNAKALKAGVVTGLGSSTGQATADEVSIGLPGLPVIKVAGVRATSTSTCALGTYTASASGTTTLGSLTIGGVSHPVASIAPNTVIRAGVATITLNEQRPVAGTSAGMLVNAVHVSAPAVADVVVSSARSGVHNCP